MPKIIKITATDGTPIEFVDKIIGSGAMKDVYFSPDKSYVVGFFREKQDQNAKERLENITGIYHDRIFKQVGGSYWKDLFCWPTKMVEYNGRIGIVCPTYQSCFFFQYGSVNNDFLGIKGKEKEGKWFASAKNQNRFLALEERGDWFRYIQISIRISRAIKRLHAAGLAHSDLSYKNVLIDPSSGKASIIDIDGLVVPGKYTPDVLGTPDFIAPEVIATKHLNINDPSRKLPSITTDRHALAVMIYMYLFYRHPLRGGKIHDLNANKDEELSMGAEALFIENPTDKSNRVKVNQLHPTELPQADPDKLPYTIGGPYLKKLFERAFIDGLHHPDLRPTANEWEEGLIKTVDLMQPCQNPTCWNKWFVFDNTVKPKCPFCDTEYKGQLPILNFYSSRAKGTFSSENYRLMVYNNQYLYQWHVNKNLFPNEKLTEEQKLPVAYFVFHQGRWLLVNQRLHDLVDRSENRKVDINETIELTDNKEILLSRENGGRLIIVQLISN